MNTSVWPLQCVVSQETQRRRINVVWMLNSDLGMTLRYSHNGNVDIETQLCSKVLLQRRGNYVSTSKNHITTSINGCLNVVIWRLNKVLFRHCVKISIANILRCQVDDGIQPQSRLFKRRYLTFSRRHLIWWIQCRELTLCRRLYSWLNLVQYCWIHQTRYNGFALEKRVKSTYG